MPVRRVLLSVTGFCLLIIAHHSRPVKPSPKTAGGPEQMPRPAPLSAAAAAVVAAGIAAAVLIAAAAVEPAAEQKNQDDDEPGIVSAEIAVHSLTSMK